MDSSILIFATDHMTREKGHWNLPFFRLGNGQSNFQLQLTGEKKPELEVNASEYSGIRWIWKNYEMIGNPDYIGHCHYRRFFANPAFFQGDNKRFPTIYSVAWKDFDNWKDGIIYPTRQLDLIMKNNVDGILPTPLIYKRSVYEMLKIYNKQLKWNIPEQIIDFAFNSLIKHLPEDMRISAKNALENNVYFHCNIFTMDKADFDFYARILDPVILETIDAYENLPDKESYGTCPRWCGFIIERLSSVIFKSLIEARKKKFIVFPLITAVK